MIQRIDIFNFYWKWKDNCNDSLPSSGPLGWPSGPSPCRGTWSEHWRLVAASPSPVLSEHVWLHPDKEAPLVPAGSTIFPVEDIDGTFSTLLTGQGLVPIVGRPEKVPAGITHSFPVMGLKKVAIVPTHWATLTGGGGGGGETEGCPYSKVAPGRWLLLKITSAGNLLVLFLFMVEWHCLQRRTRSAKIRKK